MKITIGQEFDTGMCGHCIVTALYTNINNPDDVVVEVKDDRGVLYLLRPFELEEE